MRAVLYLLLTLACLLPLTANASAIHDAAQKGDVAAITAALDAGADVNEIGGSGEATALYYSALAGNLDAARLLVARGADVNIPSRWGGPPIFMAAWQGHTSIIILLLANGANPNSQFNTDTALHKAAERGCLDCVKLLVKAGADVNANNQKREPPIHFAAKKGHSAVADYLRGNGYVTPVPPAISAKLNRADPIKGETLYLKCRNCHDRTPKMWNGYGPSLWGIVGRPIASVAEYKYSPAIRERRGTWTYEELNAFISDTSRVLPGTQMWAEDGYQNEADRVDLIAYLRLLSAVPVPLP